MNKVYETTRTGQGLGGASQSVPPSGRRAGDCGQIFRIPYLRVDFHELEGSSRVDFHELAGSSRLDFRELMFFFLLPSFQW